MGLVFEALLAVLIFIITLGGLAFTAYRMVRKSLRDNTGGSEADVISRTARCVQDIMSETEADARMALCLKHTGLQIRVHRNGYIVMRVPDFSLYPLSPLTEGKKMKAVSGTPEHFPKSGIWMSFEARELLLRTLPLHPVGILNAIIASAGSMNYETGDNAEPLMKALSADNPELMLRLHSPVSVLSSREKEKLMSVLNQKGFAVGEGDVAASLTVADLLDRAGAGTR